MGTCSKPLKLFNNEGLKVSFIGKNIRTDIIALQITVYSSTVSTVTFLQLTTLGVNCFSCQLQRFSD